MAVIDFSLDSNQEYNDLFERQLALSLSSYDNVSDYQYKSAVEESKRRMFVQYAQSLPTQDLIDTFKAGMGPQGVNTVDPVWLQNVLSGRAGMQAVGWHNDSIRNVDAWAKPVGQLSPAQLQDIQGIQNYTRDVLQGVDSGTINPSTYFGGAESASFTDRSSSSAFGQAAKSAGQFIDGIKYPLAAGAVLMGGAALAAGAAPTAGATAATATAPGVTVGTGVGVGGLESAMAAPLTALPAAGSTGGGGGGILSSIGSALGIGGGAGAGGSSMGWLDTALKLGGTAADAWGTWQQSQQQNQMMNQMQRSAQMPSVGFNIGGTGLGAQVGPGGGTVTGGPLEGLFNQVYGQAGRMAAAMPTQLPGQLRSADIAYNRALQQTPSLNLGQLQQYGGAANAALGAAFGNLQQAQQPFQPALQQAAYGGALQNLQDIQGGYQQTFDQTLGNLRASAAPQEQQMMNKLGEALFGSGRTGTTGGALQTEAMAKGLAQADIARQLQAGQEARNVGLYGLQQATGQAGLGQGITSLQDQLLSQAFGRFGQTMGLASDLERQAYGRQLEASNLGVQRAGQGLENAYRYAMALPALQSAFMSPLQGAVGIGGNLQQQLMQPFASALNMAQVQGNLSIGAGSNIANLAGSRNYDYSPWSSFASNIFAGINQ